MSIEKLARDFREGLNRAKANIPTHYREAGVNLLSLIDERVSETGTAADGSRLRGRSQGVYSSGYLKKKTEKFGRVPTYVDLTFEGNMLRSLGVIENPVLDGTRVALSLGSRDDENQKKVIANIRRYGDWLQPSTDELDEVGGILTSRILKDIGL